MFSSMLYLDKVCMYIHWLFPEVPICIATSLPFHAILWTHDLQYAEVLCETGSNHTAMHVSTISQIQTKTHKCSLGLGFI